MFSKSEKNAPKIESIVGPGTEIEGNMRVAESIRIDGKIKGEVHADSIIIGEQGVVLGDVQANVMTVGGKIKGNITAANTLQLLPKGQILGDIRTSKLVISDGACFEGNCQMMRSDGQVIEVNPQMLSMDSERDAAAVKAAKMAQANGKR